MEETTKKTELDSSKSCNYCFNQLDSFIYIPVILQCGHLVCQPCSVYIKRKLHTCPLDTLRIKHSKSKNDEELLKILTFLCAAHKNPISHICKTHLEFCCDLCISSSHKLPCETKQGSQSELDKRSTQILLDSLLKAAEIKEFEQDQRFKELKYFQTEISAQINYLTRQFEELEDMKYQNLTLELGKYHLTYEDVENLNREQDSMELRTIEIITNLPENEARFDSEIRDFYSSIFSFNFIPLSMEKFIFQSVNKEFEYHFIHKLNFPIYIKGLGIGCSTNSYVNIYSIFISVDSSSETRIIKNKWLAGRSLAESVEFPEAFCLAPKATMLLKIHLESMNQYLFKSICYPISATFYPTNNFRVYEYQPILYFVIQ